LYGLEWTPAEGREAVRSPISFVRSGLAFQSGERTTGGPFDRVMTMILGVPRELKDHESRVGVTPAGVHALVAAGHTVLVEYNAGTLTCKPVADSQHRGWRPIADLV